MKERKKERNKKRKYGKKEYIRQNDKGLGRI